MNKIIKLIPILFAVLMIFIGIADMTRPDSFRAAMDQIHMPHYILWILGVAKISGGLMILLPKIPLLLKEWAFAGFFIWSFGGISAHILSGHGLSQTTQILGLTLFLVVAFYMFRKAKN